MEKVNFVRNGVIRLPPGFRFHPTDEELVVQYLRRKVFAYPLPASIIPEIDICKHEPWELPGDREQERYFFTTREAKYRNGNRPNRATGSGYWKATGLDKRILLSKSNQVVGMKKTLVFYRGKPSNATKTDWIMHEYRLSDAATKSITEAGDWVICRVFLKKTSSKKGDHCTTAPTKYNNKDVAVAVAVDLTLGRTTFIDFMKMSSSSSSSSSSASSGITDISSNNDDSCSCSSLSASSRRREPESF